MSVERCNGARYPLAGFTLIELVVVIVITGIIASAVGVFILRPVQGFDAQIRRAELVDAAESALRRMQRDIRAALPNSVRVRESGGATGNVTCNGAGSCVIEMLNTVDGGRYRAEPPGNANAILKFGSADTDFDVLGSLQGFGAWPAAATYWVVINNQATSGAQYNAYGGDNRATLNLGGTNAGHIRINPFTFASTLASPRQRFYVVDTPITYLCDPGQRTLTRYTSYQIAVNQSSVDTAGELNALAGVVIGRAADLVQSCRFEYQPGVANRMGLVTLELQLTDPTSNESVRLLHQVHVYNAP